MIEMLVQYLILNGNFQRHSNCIYNLHLQRKWLENIYETFYKSMKKLKKKQIRMIIQMNKCREMKT